MEQRSWSSVIELNFMQLSHQSTAKAHSDGAGGARNGAVTFSFNKQLKKSKWNGVAWIKGGFTGKAWILHNIGLGRCRPAVPRGMLTLTALAFTLSAFKSAYVSLQKASITCDDSASGFNSPSLYTFRAIPLSGKHVLQIRPSKQGRGTAVIDLQSMLPLGPEASSRTKFV